MTRTNAYEFLKSQYVSQSEAADILGVSEETIRRRCHDGLLDRKYDGRTPRISAYSVQLYMNQYSITPRA